MNDMIMKFIFLAPVAVLSWSIAVGSLYLLWVLLSGKLKD